MEYILPQCFGHSPVALIGVHNSGEDILFAAHDLYGSFVSVRIKSLGKLIPTMVIEVGGVYIKNQFSVKVGICFQATSGDYALLLHLGKHLCIPGGRLLKVDVLRGAFWYNIWVGIGFFFSFVVPLGISDLAAVRFTFLALVRSIPSFLAIELLSRLYGLRAGAHFLRKCNNPL